MGHGKGPKRREVQSEYEKWQKEQSDICVDKSRELQECFDAFNVNSARKILDIISRIPRHAEVQAVRQSFKDASNTELRDLVSAKFSGRMKNVLLNRLLPVPEYRAQCVHQAVEKLFFTDKKTLIHMICPAQDLDEMQEAYQRMYGGDLAMTVASTCSGQLKELLLGLLQGHADSDMQGDLALLLQGGKKINSGVMIRILTNRNNQYLSQLFKAYKKETGGNNIENMVHKMFWGNLKKACCTRVAAVKSLSHFVAMNLESAVFKSREKRVMQLILCYDRNVHNYVESIWRITLRRVMLGIEIRNRMGDFGIFLANAAGYQDYPKQYCNVIQ